MSTERRSFTAEVRAVSPDTVELSFSSSAPVAMGDVREVLEHGPDNVDLSRLQAGAAVLLEHNRERQIGVVEKAWIDGDKGRARIRFGTSALAKEVARDVAAGVRRGVSVGYLVLKAAVVNGVRRVSKWQPYELSAVSVPADFGVGFGRSLQPTKPIVSQIQQKPNKKMDLKTMQETRGAKLKKLHNFTYESDVPTTEELETRAALEGEISRLDTAIASAKRSMTIERSSSREHGFPAIVSGNHEYSETRAISQQAKGRLDGLELETHQRLASTMPEAPRGVLIPWNSVRDMTATGTTTTTGDQGGMTIETAKGDILDPRFNAQVLRRLGATTFLGLQGNLDLPRGNAATVGWKAENETMSETSPTVATLELRPHRVGAFLDVSNQLLVQNTVGIDAWIRRNLVSAIEEEWQQAAITGTGADNQPRGILNTSGLGAVVMGTDGLAPTWAKLVELEGNPALVDADVGSLGFLVNAKTRSKLKTTLRNPSGTDAGFIWPDDSRLLGYNTGLTNAVPSNLTKGSSSGVCSAIIYGNFRDLVLAQWGGGIDVLVDPYTNAKVGLTLLVASAYLDAGVRRADSFAAIKDALTT